MRRFFVFVLPITVLQDNGEVGGDADFGGREEREAMAVAVVYPPRPVHIAFVFLIAKVEEDSDLLQRRQHEGSRIQCAHPHESLVIGEGAFGADVEGPDGVSLRSE